ncbi:urease accessory protein UreF [Geminicoccus flavidas]|uniref:urease accessory protein UreF n=1 Tax=Geminicoccus flavidas TaxID=2506407 RepID=UPI00135C6F46|nr:urease accessory UreF family protein [Geminicoccus flavidas]
MAEDRSAPALLRLLAWTSPAFPIGGFAFSHGLETAVEEGLVRDMGSLLAYASQACRHGAGYADAVILARAHALADDPAGLTELLDQAHALRGTAELALETGMQGDAALRTLRAAWPAPQLDRLAGLAVTSGIMPALPVVLGVAAAAHGIPAEQACLGQLAAFAACLISAGVRLVPLGQTDGQRATAALEPLLAELAARAPDTALSDLYPAAPMIDLLSIAHETQYTRLFRS